jgi:hypothetical protein
MIIKCAPVRPEAGMFFTLVAYSCMISFHLQNTLYAVKKALAPATFRQYTKHERMPPTDKLM